jgi:hypothetical protein
MGKVPLYFIITFGNKLAVVPPCVQALTESEKMLRTVISNQRLGDDFFAGLDAIVAQGRELQRVSLPVEDGFKDRDSAHSCDVADDMVQLQVHLIQRLLNPLRICACRLHQAVAMAQQGTEGTDLLRRPERSLQQAHRMKILQPLAIGNIGLAPGHVLHMMSIDQAHLEPPLFRDLEERYPEHSGGLHGDGFDPATLQPVASRCKSSVNVLNERTGCGSRSTGTAT